MKKIISIIITICCVLALSAVAQNKDTSPTAKETPAVNNTDMKPSPTSPAQDTAVAAQNAPATTKEVGAVIGKVIASNNNPLKDAAVDVVLNIPRPPKVGDAPQPRRPVLGKGRTLEDGTFKIENVPVGSYILNIHYVGTPECHPGGAPAFEIKANETVDVGTLTLKLR